MLSWVSPAWYHRVLSWLPRHGIDACCHGYLCRQVVSSCQVFEAVQAVPVSRPPAAWVMMDNLVDQSQVNMCYECVHVCVLVCAISVCASVCLCACVHVFLCFYVCVCACVVACVLVFVAACVCVLVHVFACA